MGRIGEGDNGGKKQEGRAGGMRRREEEGLPFPLDSRKETWSEVMATTILLASDSFGA